MASQMTNAKVKNLTVDIKANQYIFKMGSSKVMFDGFTKIYNADEELENAKQFPDLNVGDVLDLKKLNHEQHFTQPPARYSEASLVKQLEEYGIGRPSTYAPIITKIQQRNYVEKLENKSLKPTPLGRTICKQLNEYFVKIMDYEFNKGTLAIVPDGKGNSIVYEDYQQYTVEKKPYIIMDESCPKKLEIVNTTIDTVFKKYNLYISWE